MNAPAPQKKTRFISVGLKLAAATLVVLGLATAAVYTALIEHERQSLFSAKEVAGEMVTNLFAANASAALEFEDPEAINEAIGKLSGNEEIVYGALWGVDMLSGELGPRSGEFRRDGFDGEISETASGESGTRWNDDTVRFTVDVKDAMGERVGRALVVFSLARENALLESSKRSILLTSLGIAGALALLVIGLAKLVVIRPLDRVIRAAAKLESGDTKAGAAELSNAAARDEVGKLAVGFRHMAEAIDEREAKIARARARLEGRNRDMRLVLDNVEQGFVTMNLDGSLDPERSASFDEWFAVHDDGESFWQVIGRVDEEFATWLELGWESVTDGFLPLELALDQMPSSAKLGERYFQFGYNPITDDGELTKALIVVTDVTADVERKEGEMRQGELLEVFTRISRDRAGFMEFYAETGRIVDEIQTEADEPLIKRLIHTVKGNCGIYGLPTVARVCHEVEEAIAERGEVTVDDKQAIEAAWSDLRERIAPLLGNTADRIELDRAEYEAFVASLEGRPGQSDLAATAASWVHEPAKKRLTRFAEQAEEIARKLGKGEIETEVEAGALRFPAPRWQGFWSSFTHVVRNAVDHGLETPEARVAAGKPAAGKLHMGMRKAGSEVIVELRDDGRGVDWAKIAEKAAGKGLPHRSQADLVAALFTDGLSSRDTATTTSGRGVGMAAVKEATEAMGGRIQVQSKDGEGTVFRFRFPVSALQARANGAPPAALGRKQHVA